MFGSRRRRRRGRLSHFTFLQVDALLSVLGSVRANALAT